MGALNKANSRQNRNHAQAYKRYKDADRRGVNKAKKLLRHMNKFPSDELAKQAYKEISELSKKQAMKELKQQGALYL